MLFLCSSIQIGDAQLPQSTCIAHLNQMPSHWQPHQEIMFKHSSAKWSEQEDKLRVHAVRKGLEEMIEF